MRSRQMVENEAVGTRSLVRREQTPAGAAHFGRGLQPDRPNMHFRASTGRISSVHIDFETRMAGKEFGISFVLVLLNHENRKIALRRPKTMLR